MSLEGDLVTIVMHILCIFQMQLAGGLVYNYYTCVNNYFQMQLGIDLVYNYYINYYICDNYLSVSNFSFNIIQWFY